MTEFKCMLGISCVTVGGIIVGASSSLAGVLLGALINLAGVGVVAWYSA